MNVQACRYILNKTEVKLNNSVNMIQVIHGDRITRHPSFLLSL